MIFLAAGPDIRKGSIDGLTTMEVAPLLLALTGLPISDQLPGRLEEEVFRPGYTREHPVSRVPRYPNTIVATGHGMMGVSMAPATARLVSAMVTGRDPFVDATPYSLARFGIG